MQNHCQKPPRQTERESGGGLALYGYDLVCGDVCFCSLSLFFLLSLFLYHSLSLPLSFSFSERAIVGVLLSHYSENHSV